MSGGSEPKTEEGCDRKIFTNTSIECQGEALPCSEEINGSCYTRARDQLEGIGSS